MILEIFILLFLISLSFIILGYFTLAPPIQIIGYTFVFILGLVVMFGGLQYKTGESEIYNYGANFTNSVHWDSEHPTSYPAFTPNTDPIYLFHLNKTNIYSDFDNEIVADITVNHFFGLFLAISGVLGFISVMLNLGVKKKKKNREDYDEN